MPSPMPSERASVPTRRYSVALEPAVNALNSLILLNSVPEVLRVGEWIVRTAAAVPPALAGECPVSAASAIGGDTREP